MEERTEVISESEIVILQKTRRNHRIIIVILCAIIVGLGILAFMPKTHDVRTQQKTRVITKYIVKNHTTVKVEKQYYVLNPSLRLVHGMGYVSTVNEAGGQNIDGVFHYGKYINGKWHPTGQTFKW